MQPIFKEPNRRKFLAYGFVASLWTAFKTSRLFADDTNPSALNKKENTDVSQMKSDSQAAREKRLSRKLNSPQFREGKFRNPLPEQTDTFTALRKFVLAGSAFREPDQPLPTERRKRADFEIAPQSNLRVTWLGHASLLVEIDGKRFLTDPVWGERASPFTFAGPKRFFEPPLPLSELPKLNAIILSHNHYDHLCTETIEALVNQDVPFLVPLGVGNQLEDLGVPHSRIQEYDWWEETQIEGVRLACTPARHFSGRSLFDRNSTLWCSWTFIGNDHRFFFSGDTAMFPGFKDIGEKYGPFDLVAMEAGAYNAAWPDVHIGPEQALQAFQDLKGKVLLPIHWATFNLSIHNWTEPGERILAGALLKGISVALPKPGQSVEPDHLTAQLEKKWWPEVPWLTAEQSPVVSSGL